MEIGPRALTPSHFTKAYPLCLSPSSLAEILIESSIRYKCPWSHTSTNHSLSSYQLILSKRHPWLCHSGKGFSQNEDQGLQLDHKSLHCLTAAPPAPPPARLLPILFPWNSVHCTLRDAGVFYVPLFCCILVNSIPLPS